MCSINKDGEVSCLPTRLTLGHHSPCRVLLYQALLLFPGHASQGWKREHSWDRGAGPWYKGSRIRSEVCSCIRAGGWSHISPAAAMQTDCRPTPEPNAAACWVKNSLSSPPTPFSDGLFLTQNIYGFGLPQSPHPIAPTRMRAFKKNKQLHH